MESRSAVPRFNQNRKPLIDNNFKVAFARVSQHSTQTMPTSGAETPLPNLIHEPPSLPSSPHRKRTKVIEDALPNQQNITAGEHLPKGDWHFELWKLG